MRANIEQKEQKFTRRLNRLKILKIFFFPTNRIFKTCDRILESNIILTRIKLVRYNQKI